MCFQCASFWGRISATDFGRSSGLPARRCSSIQRNQAFVSESPRCEMRASCLADLDVRNRRAQQHLHAYRSAPGLGAAPAATSARTAPYFRVVISAEGEPPSPVASDEDVAPAHAPHTNGAAAGWVAARVGVLQDIEQGRCHTDRGVVLQLGGRRSAQWLMTASMSVTASQSKSSTSSLARK